jgi:hypothetical protein
MAGNHWVLRPACYLTGGALATILIAALWGWSPPIAIVAGLVLALSTGWATERVVERLKAIGR